MLAFQLDLWLNCHVVPTVSIVPPMTVALAKQVSQSSISETQSLNTYISQGMLGLHMKYPITESITIP